MTAVKVALPSPCTVPSTMTEIAEPKSGMLLATSPMVLTTALPTFTLPSPYATNEFASTLPKIFISLASDGRKP